MAHDRIVYGFNVWDFVAIRGVPQLPRWTLKTLKQPGVDGKAFKFLSREGQPSTLMLEAVAADLSDEVDWLAAMSALVGTQIVLYSSTSLVYANWAVTDCRHVGSQAVAIGKWGPLTLGADARFLQFELTVEYPYGVA